MRRLLPVFLILIVALGASPLPAQTVVKRVGMVTVTIDQGLAFPGGLFVVRAAAGAEAVHVPISPWLLLCTALLALFLALAKRRGELVLVGADATPGRPVLEGYSLALVDQLVSVVAASTVIAYSLYTFTARDSKAMMATIPFVLFGVFRYLLLINRDDLGEEPETILFTDGPLIATLALWAVASAAILALA